MPRPRPAIPAEQEELLGSVIRQADALMRILTAVLEISRSEALTGRNQFAWFDVGELAAELAEMYDPLAEERGAALDYDRPGAAGAAVRPPPVARAGDQQPRSRMRSATAPAAARSRFASSPANEQIRIEVADRGPGIPRDRRAEARRRFGRLDSSRSDEGAGLGLALAEAIAHLHEGELMLEDNEPGLLTVLELPVHSQAAACGLAAEVALALDDDLGADLGQAVELLGEFHRQADAAVAGRITGIGAAVERDPVLVDALHERHRRIVVLLRAVERPLLENRPVAVAA